MSTLELHQELEQILADNPLLERTDDPLDHAIRLLADGAIGAAGTVAEGASVEANAQTPESEASFDAPEVAESTNGDTEWSFDDVARTSKAPSSPARTSRACASRGRGWRARTSA